MITSVDTNATYGGGDSLVCKKAGVTRPDLVKKLRDLDEKYYYSSYNNNNNYGSYTRAAKTLATKGALINPHT